MSGRRMGWLIGGALAMVAIASGLAVGAVTTRDQGAGEPSTPPTTDTVPATEPAPTTGGSVPPGYTLPDLGVPQLTTSTTTTLVPPAARSPFGLGSDAELDELAEDCYEGDMTACDDLYAQAPAASEYAAFGDTCAGRQPEDTRRYCADVFGG